MILKDFAQVTTYLNNVCSGFCQLKSEKRENYKSEHERLVLVASAISELIVSASSHDSDEPP